MIIDIVWTSRSNLHLVPAAEGGPLLQEHAQDGEAVVLLQPEMFHLLFMFEIHTYMSSFLSPLWVLYYCLHKLSVMRI